MSSEEPTNEVQPLKTTSQVVPPAPYDRDAPSDQQTEIRKELGDFERISFRIQRRVLYATWAIAAITGVYVFVTFRQWRTMKDQLGVMSNQLSDARKAAKDADKITERQLKLAESQGVSLGEQANALRNLVIATTSAAGAAKASAENSSKALDKAETQFRISQESELVFDGVGGHGEPAMTIKAGTATTMRAYFRNVGRSSATISRLQFCNQTAPALAREVTCAVQNDFSMTWGPDAARFLSTEFAPLTQQTVDDISDEKQRLWIVYKFEYRDRFTRPRIMEGCQMTKADMGTWVDCKPHISVRPE